MKLKITNRQFLSFAIIIFYLVPLLVFTLYSQNLTSNKHWGLFSGGLLGAVAGTFILSLLLYYWESSLHSKTIQIPLEQPLYTQFSSETKVTSIAQNLDKINYAEEQNSCSEFAFIENALKEHQAQLEKLSQLLELKNEELDSQVEKNHLLQIQINQITHEFAEYKLSCEDQIKHQRTEMEKRQEQIYQLDSKVHDLSYEIRLLLHINKEKPLVNHPLKTHKEIEMARSVLVEEKENTFTDKNSNFTGENSVKTALEASNLLRKCINMAQKLSGAKYYQENSTHREFPPSHYTIDQRRLFDNLSHETGAIIFVYSKNDNKLLFVNNEIKAVLGWNPKRFIEDFSTTNERFNEWKNSLHSLGPLENQNRLVVKTTGGQEIVLNSCSGNIPTGLFRNYVISILYSS